MKPFFLFPLIIIFSNFLFSQSLSHPINPNPDYSIINSKKIDTINILAIMVDFVEDKDASTYGTGKFGSHYSKEYGTSIIDPLPHNKTYFESQLLGLKNYFSRVSENKLIINYTVLDKIVNMSDVMSKYSPAPKSNDFSILSKMYLESWKKTDSLYKNTDFSSYNLFVIFHAGVGRDINIAQNFNLEKDIPSLYLNLNSLKKFIGQDYNGEPIGTTKKLVQNTIIIPETDSREVSSFSGKVLLEIGIQGLLASSVASFLGLPDLYDTQTGLSAIGRFGLMDGQAIFNYGGVLPPEPSAWEKIFLGWKEPQVLSVNDISSKTNINVITKFNSPDHIFNIIKIPINTSEYFLIENRQRDALKNGSVITYIIDGVQYQKTFPKDTTGFQYYDIDSLNGVIIGVDENDWSLPGSGILIWHIDEKVIAEKIVENKINTNPKHKGVYVVEADGIQDIGVKFMTIFGDEVIGDGEQDDMWFKGNTAKLFTNLFNETSKPNSNSNSDAPSYINISNFSENNNVMNFDIIFGNEEIKPKYVEKFSNSFTNPFIMRNYANSKLIFYHTDNKIFSYDRQNKNNLVFDEPVNFQPTSFEFYNSQYFGYVKNDSLILIKYDNNGILDQYKYLIDFNSTNSACATHLIVKKLNNQSSILSFGDSKGNIFNFNLETKTFNKISLDTSAIKHIAYSNNYLVASTNNSININSNKFDLKHKNPIKIIIAQAENNIDNNFVIVLSENNFVEILNNFGSVSNFKLPYSENINVKDLSVADIKNDGNLYIIYNNTEKLIAINKFGYLASSFPISKPATTFLGQSNLADINEDGVPEIFIQTGNGELLCYNTLSAELLKKYTLSVGYTSSGSNNLLNCGGKFYYESLSDSGYYQLFQLSPTIKNIAWNGKFGDLELSNSSKVLTSKNQEKEFLPKSKVYNWPNPVYESSTNIRYFVSEDSKINIKIFDLAGGLVAELNNSAPAGLESETIWNVSNIQNGIYLAKIEATSSSKTDNAIIKIAVIK